MEMNHIQNFLLLAAKIILKYDIPPYCVLESQMQGKQNSAIS